MKKMSILSSIWLTVLSSQLWAAAWDQLLPTQTAPQKAEAFLKINAFIPSMADGAARYGFDPITLFEYQAQTENMISHDSTYQLLKQKHPDLIELSLFEQGSGSSSSTTEKEKLWLDSMHKAAQTVRELNLKSEPEVTAEILKIIASPLLGKTQALHAGLAQLLPADLRKSFFSLPLDKKLIVLKEHLPEEIVSHGFTPARLGWKDTEISKAEIISRLQEAAAIEQRLTSLAIYQVSQQKDHSNPKEFLANAGLNPASRKPLEQWLQANVLKLIPQETKSSPPDLILREVPPAVAVFRGFAGNDCSTTCSFPFVNSPNEYTFLVYDAKSQIKGYVQATKVLTHDEPSLYLHTIAGPRISGKDTLLIMKSFLQERKRLGFHEVLLPAMDKVEAMINFIPIRQAVRQVLTDTALPLKYEDDLLRQNFKSTFKLFKAYDDAASNPFGYKINEALLPQLQVSQREAPSLDQVSNQVDRNDLILILLQLGKNLDKNRPMIQALATQAQIPFIGIQELITICENKELLKTSDLIERLSAKMKQLEFTFKDDYFQKNISVIAHGLLKSPDIMNDPAYAELVLLNLLDQRDSARVENFLRQHPQLFKNDRLTFAFFKTFYNDIHEADFLNSNILSVALTQKPSAILKNSELLALLKGSPKAVSLLSDFVITNPAWAQVLPKESGKEILLLVQERIALRDGYIRSILAAKSEFEFDQKMNAANLDMNRRNIKLDEASKIKLELQLQTLDRYISFAPKVSVNTVFYTLCREIDKDLRVRRALRKLLPLALKNGSSTYQLTSYLETASKLRATSNDPENFDHMILESLMSRPDREKLQLNNTQLLPSIQWNLLKAPRCEALFN